MRNSPELPEEHPQAVVWRGDQNLPVEQILGSPVGHNEFKSEVDEEGDGTPDIVGTHSAGVRRAVCMAPGALFRCNQTGCELPTWLDLVDGVRPPIPMDGWQHFVSDTVEERHLHETLRALLLPQRALVRSQGGPLSVRPCVCCPTSRLTKFQPQSFRILLLRRLHLPLPLSSRSCRCGRLLDCLGHHRLACAVAGVLGRRGFAVESAIARICREGGARVSNVFVRDLDLGAFNHLDGRRLEVVADGLSLFVRGSVGNRHNSRFRFASRRHSDQRCCQSQRRGHSGSTQTEGENVPGTCRRRRSCQVGHTRRRSWWQVVD